MKQLRIVCLGDYDNYLSYFNYGVIEGAIRNGAWCRPVPMFNHDLNTIKSQITWFKPHIIVAHCLLQEKGQHNISNLFEMLRSFRRDGIFVCLHEGDARSIPRYPRPINDVVDIALLNNGLLAEYSSYWKVPCYRWPYMCLYQDNIAEKEELYKCDLAFTGMLSNDAGNVHNDRTVLINKLINDSPLLIKIFPNQQTGNTRFQTAELASSADLVFGMQMVRDMKGYIDVRPFQYIGAGAIYIHDKADQLYEYFEPKIHYLEYDRHDPETVIELHDYYIKKHPKEGEKIRRQGFEYCQRFHSTKERVKKIIELYKEIKQ